MTIEPDEPPPDPEPLDALVEEYADLMDTLGELDLDDAEPAGALLDIFRRINPDHLLRMEWIDLLPEEAVTSLPEPTRERVVDALLAALGGDHAGLIAGAADALGKAGSRRAVGPLIGTLRHPHPTVRGLAARALGRIGDMAAQEPLIPLLEDDHWFVREETANALRRLPGERALEPLIAAFGRLDLAREEFLPLALIQAIARIRHPRAEAALLDILKNTPRDEGDVREEAMTALAEQGSQAAVRPLIAALAEDDRGIKMSAANALGRLGDRRAVEPLLALLDDPDEGVRGWAARALGLLGDRRALPILHELVEADHVYVMTGVRVSDLAREAIEKIEAVAPGGK